MICDEDPLRRRPRESTARRKRQERCVWMARKMTEWPSKRGPITKIMPSDGCIGDTVPLAVGKWYEFHEFGWYMGNVGEGYRECGSEVMTVRREQTATGSAMSSLHMDTGRFLYDDGHSTNWQAAIGKTQGVRRVGGCAAAGAHAASRIRQEGRGGAQIEHG